MKWAHWGFKCPPKPPLTLYKCALGGPDGKGYIQSVQFFSLFPWFLLALVSFHLFLSFSLSLLPEQRVLQRNQAGLAYWKQMADQRQEGHGFMKRASNMPGSCRGAWPRMTAASVRAGACFCLSEHFVKHSHSFYSDFLDAARWLPLCLKDLMALKPLTPGVLLWYESANQKLMPGIHQIWANRWGV